MNKRALQLIAAILGVAAVVAIVVLLTTSGGGGGTAEKVEGTDKAAALFGGIPQDGISLGRPDAPVTMVEFADLQCPFCRDYSEQVLPTLVKDYVRPGKLRIEFHLLGFVGPDSGSAAEVAEAAGLQDKLWDYTDVFYANQGEENTGYVTDDFLKKIAKGTPGLDADKAIADRSSPEVAKQLAAAEAAGQARAVDSTPSFFIGRGKDLAPLKLAALEPGAFTGPIDQLLRGK